MPSPSTDFTDTQNAAEQDVSPSNWSVIDQHNFFLWIKAQLMSHLTTGL